MADLVIERCLPSERAAEIQSLFTRAGQPEFTTVFERTYRPREPLGLRSWVGAANGKAVLHISVSLETFSDGRRTLVGGILGDLIADESHRDFWGPVKLARKMVADVRKDRSVDFLLTSYAPQAKGVFKAAGFKDFAALVRLVLPVVWPYPLMRRLLHRQRVPTLTTMPFDDPRVGGMLDGMSSPRSFRAMPHPVYFTTRMPRSEYPAGTWLIAGDPQRPDAAVLVAPKPVELAVADVYWRNEGFGLAGLFSAVARWASRAGHRKIAIMTTERSAIDVAARKAGFLPREHPYLVMMLPLTTTMEDIPSPEQWSFTPFVLTSW